AQRTILPQLSIASAEGRTRIGTRVSGGAMAGRPVNYSATQIVLHWSVAALVLFQFVAHGPMEAAWRAVAQSGTVDDYTLRFANLHAVTGGLIFCLAVWRVALRLTRGAPTLPAEEPAPLRFLANATH